MKRISQDLEDKIWELKNKGYNQPEIARTLGISKQLVSKKLSFN